MRRSDTIEHNMKTVARLIILVMAVMAVGGGSIVHAATTDDFTITSFRVEMTLGRDGDNRSTLRTVETITAEFPEIDQNHGLERVFVRDYNDHPTHITVTSVADQNGQELPYHWQDDALRIGEKDTYVHGSQTYVITYTQRDVTRFYADTDRDEFYWDVIGTNWQVPIASASVALTLDQSIAGAHSNEAQCYAGISGDTTSCDIAIDTTAVPVTYRASADNLGSGRGMTVALGFAKGTFAEYKPSLLYQVFLVWNVVQQASIALGVALVGWLIVKWSALTSRRKEIGTIVPEYLPPKNVSVTTSARVGGYRNAVMTAQLLDLAVRHYIKIYEVKEKTLFRPAEYEIEIVKLIDDLKWEEKEILIDTFGESPTSIGQRINLKTLKNNTAYYWRTLNNDTDLDKLIKGEYGLKSEDETIKKWLRRVAKIILVIAVVLLSFGLAIAAFVAFIMSLIVIRLTDDGLALTRYLKGLKMYIGVAEAERLKMLQSPEGAEKIASVAKGTDQAQLIKLYERVLPYAVLFGQEKQWNKQLGSYYETSGIQPDWYVGRTGAFNAAAFSSGMSGLSSASNSVSSASSSSGGSSGGGSSGGGGGGGGGGGW